MAVWTSKKIKGIGEIFETTLTAGDVSSEVLQTASNHNVTYAIKTTGAATVDVIGFLEDPEEVGATGFTLFAAEATAGGADVNRSSLGPLAGLQFAGAVTGPDTALIQALISKR